MVHSPASALRLFEGDETQLRGLLRSTTAPVGVVKRARIVLLASEGIANTRIAELVDASVVTVLKWRGRYEQAGLAGLVDAGRSGRPRHLDHGDIIAATLMPPPKKYGITHWSSRSLGMHLKVGNATVARAWREYGIQPWKSQTFKFSTDPELVGKVTDVVPVPCAAAERCRAVCGQEIADPGAGPDGSDAADADRGRGKA